MSAAPIRIEGHASRTDATIAGRRGLLLLTAMFMAPAVCMASVALSVPMALAGLALALVALSARAETLERFSGVGRRYGVVVAAIASLQVVTTVATVSDAPGRSPGQGLLLRASLAVLSGGAVMLALLPRPIPGLILTSLLVAGTAVAMHCTSPVMDVLVFERHGSSMLLRGINPYAITFPNPFPPEVRDVFYGPGIAVGDRILVGFPYPPVSLVLSAAGFLIGDVRYSACALVTAASLLLWWHARDTLGRAGAILLLGMPGLLFTLDNGWTEPLVLGLLALTVVATTRGWSSAPYLLGALLVSKQYMLFTVPLLMLLLPSAHKSSRGVRGFFARAALSATTWTLPFLLWSPKAFWDSVVVFQFRQPFRSDSVSALVALVEHTGWPPSWTFGILPLAAATLTSILLALRAPRTPASFAACVAVTLTVMFVTSKQAFGNYYFLAVGALLISVTTWRADIPGAGSSTCDVRGAVADQD